MTMLQLENSGLGMPPVIAGGTKIIGGAGIVLRKGGSKVFKALDNIPNPFRISTGLSGKWVNANEYMSETSRVYQRQITGTDEVWLQNGVKFDGMRDGILLEVKGNYSDFIDNQTGEFFEWFTGQEDLIYQATRQLNASEGGPIYWYFSDEASMNVIQKLLQSRGIKGINFICEPLK